MTKDDREYTEAPNTYNFYDKITEKVMGKVKTVELNINGQMTECKYEIRVIGKDIEKNKLYAKGLLVKEKADE